MAGGTPHERGCRQALALAWAFRGAKTAALHLHQAERFSLASLAFTSPAAAAAKGARTLVRRSAGRHAAPCASFSASAHMQPRARHSIFIHITPPGRTWPVGASTQARRTHVLRCWGRGGSCVSEPLAFHRVHTPGRCTGRLRCWGRGSATRRHCHGRTSCTRQLSCVKGAGMQGAHLAWAGACGMGGARGSARSGDLEHLSNSVYAALAAVCIVLLAS